MKVLFVSNDPTIFDPTSAARARMHEYALAIGELHIVSVAREGARGGQEGNLFLYPVQASKLFRIRVLARCAHEIILKHDIEVVSAQDPFEHGLAALRAVRGTNVRLHIQVHTDFLSPWFVRSGNWRSPKVHVPFINYIRRRWASTVLIQADGIRVVSERIKKSIIATYGAKIKEPLVIPIMINPEVPERVLLPKHHFTFALISVSRLEPEKRIEDILAALKLVVAKYPMVGLFIAGHGSERERLESITQELGLENSVIFIGNRIDARGLMRSAQAFIQASAYEGYGASLVEAALAKVPIITTDVGIVGEVFRGYEEVLSVPVADPTALSLAIVGLIEDNEVRQELPRRAEEAVLAHLSSVGDIPKRIAEDLSQVAKKRPYSFV